jgi:uncharacterized protein YdiU (UPF0061 family)
MPSAPSAAGWRFDNSYARLPAGLFTRTLPQPVCAPRLVALNEPLAEDLGLDPAILCTVGATIFAGNEVPLGADPIAQAYAGHQFGIFTNLGDGRAILLGEQLTPDGRRFDIQLKGSGRTPYSRNGDGRAALGPMLREFLISEGMHALGIPTSRSLAVVATGEAVLRERALPGAVLTRVAASHIRVGTFEYAAAVGDQSLLAALLDHSIARHYPEIAEASDKAAAFLEAVMERQAALIAKWMLVGFVHGVMNTDNMAVSGETIDYGPCAFLDAYDPTTTFSSIDRDGRYAYANQPEIALWNLARLAESLLPLMPGSEAAAVARARGLLTTFPERFRRHHLAGARAKLGLATEEPGDADLFPAVLAWMRETHADFTATWGRWGRELIPDRRSGQESAPVPVPQWQARLAREPGDPAEIAARLRRANPLVIPRNHRVEEALAAAEAGDLGPFERLLAALRTPFAETAETDPYRSGPPAGCGPYRTFCGT